MTPEEMAEEVSVDADRTTVRITFSVITMSFPRLAAGRVETELRDFASEMFDHADAAYHLGAFGPSEMREAAGVALQIAERLREL